MGNPLDDITGSFSAMINGVEHVAQDAQTLIGKAAGELESLGIGTFGGMEGFIQFLIHLGEDPVHVISQLWSRITAHGGTATSVLEEMAHGIETYGLTGYFTRMTNQAVSPIKDALNGQTKRASQIADLHQTTVSTMQKKLTTLTAVTTPSSTPMTWQGTSTDVTTGTAPSTMTMAWQGTAADTMNASFGDISQFLSQLNDQIHNNGQQASLNHAFLQVLEFTEYVAIGMVVLDILLVIVNAVILVGSAAFAGVGVLAGAAIDALLDTGVLALEIEILLALVAADALAWLIGTLAIYATQHPLTHTGTSAPTVSKPQVLQLNLPKGPEVTPGQQATIEDLVRELAAKLGVSAESLQKWLQLIAQALGPGISGEALKSIIRCLAAKGYLDASFKSGWNSVADHLTPRDLQGAWGDYNGYDTSADHWGEVNGGLDSLRNYITMLNGKIADRTISAAQRAVYKALRDAAQKTIDYVTNLIQKGKKQGPSTNEWPDPKGRVPFVEEVLKASGCVPS